MMPADRRMEATARTQNGLVAVRTGEWPEGRRVEMQLGPFREMMTASEARTLAAILFAAGEELDKP